MSPPTNAPSEIHTGLVIASHGAQAVIEDQHGQPQRCALRRSAGPVVVGDHVQWAPTGIAGEAVISACLPRRSLLVNTRGHKPYPVAANLDQIIVVCPAQPQAESTWVDLIDRYLAAAELNDITPCLLINKVDVIAADNGGPLRALAARYHAIGYAVAWISAVTGAGMEELAALLQGHTSVFVGPSGAGKSSLINRCIPHAALRTGAVAEHSGLGRHTTTTATLHHLPSGGDVIDSPGVREFGLGAVTPRQLAHGFREFRPYVAQCRFRDCTHLVEPGCAVRAAVGQISPERLASFERIAREPNIGRR